MSASKGNRTLQVFATADFVRSNPTDPVVGEARAAQWLWISHGARVIIRHGFP